MDIKINDNGNLAVFQTIVHVHVTVVLSEVYECCTLILPYKLQPFLLCHSESESSAESMK